MSLLIHSLSSEALRWIKWKVLQCLKNECLVANMLSMPVGDIWRKLSFSWLNYLKYHVWCLAKVSLLIRSLTSEALRWSKWKVLMPWKNKCLLAIFSFMLVEDIWRKPLIELTKLAKISCKLFSYGGVIPESFLNLRSSNMEQMKSIDAMKK